MTFLQLAVTFAEFAFTVHLDTIEFGVEVFKFKLLKASIVISMQTMAASI